MTTTRRAGAGVAIAAAIAVTSVLCGGLPAAAKDATPVSAAFTVDVSLSPRALARLTQLREGIVVSALYYGEATRAARKKADEMGQIALGDEKALLPATGGRAAIRGANFDPRKVDWVVDRKAMVNINVFTARRSDPNNLLSCDLFDDALTLAVAGPIPISCKLIEEH
ncbi:hypothetical protein EYW49_10745 [Siculibacillus lacustris]|uniref:Uncharacterized protein n=1 Tax=Siculibacillus lacustris TaxID=1549641 RepID=A0A4Q9VPZ6_9HYPH|nr:hypothetical protein [Siculibacillus lacustris]TBW37580.1 hypothetical protein EYW49_10745 [Siculibacillus lacustris]